MPKFKIIWRLYFDQLVTYREGYVSDCEMEVDAESIEDVQEQIDDGTIDLRNHDYVLDSEPTDSSDYVDSEYDGVTDVCDIETIPLSPTECRMGRSLNVELKAPPVQDPVNVFMYGTTTTLEVNVEPNITVTNVRRL